MKKSPTVTKLIQLLRKAQLAHSRGELVKYSNLKSEIKVITKKW